MAATSVSKDKTVSGLPPEARRRPGQDKIDVVTLEMLASMKKLPPKLRSGALSDFLLFASMMAGIAEPTGKGVRHG